MSIFFYFLSQQVGLGSDDRAKAINKIYSSIQRIQPNRFESAKNMFERFGDMLLVSVSKTDNQSVFTIKSVSDENQCYIVKITEGRVNPLARNKLNRFEFSCDCEDFSHRALKSCKHGLYAMILKFSKWSGSCDSQLTVKSSFMYNLIYYSFNNSMWFVFINITYLLFRNVFK